MAANTKESAWAKPLFYMTWASLIGLVVFAGVFGRQSVHWDGGFPDIAFEFTFQDPNGHPIEGVELFVEQDDGSQSFHRPINDYYSGRIPSSSKKGIMSFHSIDIVYGGHCETYFFYIESGDCDAPRYLCRFFRNGHEVHQIPFSELFDYQGDYERRLRKVKLPAEGVVEELWLNGKMDQPLDESRLHEVERELYIVKKTITIESSSD